MDLPKNNTDVENTTPALENEENTVDAIAVAQANLDKANVALANAQAKVVEAGSDLKAMMQAAAELMAAGRNQEKAQRAYTDATFEIKAAERMAFSVGLKEAIEAFVNEIDTSTMTELGLKGFTVTLDPESELGAIVNIVGAKAASTSTPRVKKEGSGGGSSKSNVLYNGTEYKASEFIIEFGGAEGAEAIDKARNYKDHGLKFSPGFDQFKRKLMKQLGATFVDGTSPE